MSEYREIKVPSLGESVSEATVALWTKQVGQAVQADELLVELETDKITMEVTASATGALSAINFPVGATVTVGQILGVIEVGAQESAEILRQKSKETVEKPVAEETSSPEAPPLSSSPLKQKASSLAEDLAPSVRKIVAEKELNPASIAGTGKDGRLTKGDVLEVEKTTDQQFKSPMASSRVSGEREERVRMSRLRQKIAERLKVAQNTAAILTTFNEVDMTNVFRIRNQYKESFEKKHGVKLGFMSFFVKAAIQALKEIPEINAEIDGDTIVYKNYYDIGVAVSAPQGLVVPVVRDADLMTFSDIERKISELGNRAREGKLSIDEMTGGTFTISNGGVFGSLMSTPIINPPQTGIMGMHKIQERPVAIDGKVEIRPMMYIALSYDHRLIDGREAVTFLVRVKENIENPERLLLSV